MIYISIFIMNVNLNFSNNGKNIEKLRDVPSKRPISIYQGVA